MSEKRHRSALVALLFSCMFLAELGTSVRPVRAEHGERAYERGEHDRGYNAEYIFAATYGLTDMHVPAALKVPLVPVTLLMDVALLPFEVVAGCF
jgi:hypothetical protein